MKRLYLTLALCVGGVVGCLPAGVQTTPLAVASTTGACTFPSSPTLIREDGAARLVMWEVDEDELWSSSRLPADDLYQQYRRQLEVAGADQMHPAQHVPEEQQGEAFWARELHNVELAYSGTAGTLRPVRCLDALLFATQNARVRQLVHPTEFLASILRKTMNGDSRLRIYLGAGDELYPPKSVYGFDLVERDVADGWEYAAMLHNHTLQEVEGQVRLGVPAPSISDVQLLRGLVERADLDYAWITNGVYTLEVMAPDLGLYQGPD